MKQQKAQQKESLGAARVKQIGSNGAMDRRQLSPHMW